MAFLTTGPALLSFVLFCSMVAIFLSGFSTDQWFIYEDDNDQLSIGLWKFCNSTNGWHNCSSYSHLEHTTKIVIQHIQTLMCVGLVFIVAEFVVFCIGLDARITTAIGLLVGVCVLVVVAGFTKQMPDSYGSYNKRPGINGWGFCLACVSIFFSFANYIITTLWMCCSGNNNTGEDEPLISGYGGCFNNYNYKIRTVFSRR